MTTLRVATLRACPVVRASSHRYRPPRVVTNTDTDRDIPGDVNGPPGLVRMHRTTTTFRGRSVLGAAFGGERTTIRDASHQSSSALHHSVWPRQPPAVPQPTLRRRRRRPHRNEGDERDASFSGPSCQERRRSPIPRGQVLDPRAARLPRVRIRRLRPGSRALGSAETQPRLRMHDEGGDRLVERRRQPGAECR